MRPQDVLPQLTIREARFNKREEEKKIWRRGGTPLTLIYNWNGEQNECEAETSHLLCCSAEAERPSAPESVLTFTFSSEKKKKSNLDYRLKIIQSAITNILYLNIQCTVHTLNHISAWGKNLPVGKKRWFDFSFSTLTLFYYLPGTLAHSTVNIGPRISYDIGHHHDPSPCI